MLWTARPRTNGRLGKVPLAVVGGHLKYHDVNDPAGWSDWSRIRSLYLDGGPGDGIGYALTDSGLTCIDVDRCVEDGHVSPAALDLAASLGGYCEYSPGDGIHVLVSDSVPSELWRNRDLKVDVLRRGFVTVTGQLLSLGTASRQVQQNPVGARSSRSQVLPLAPPPLINRDVEADAIFLRQLRNGGKFRRLFDAGDTRGYSSHSEAVFALLRLAHFAMGNAPDALNAIFWASALSPGYAAKWTRTVSSTSPTTIGELTIARVIAAGGPVHCAGRERPGRQRGAHRKSEPSAKTTAHQHDQHERHHPSDVHAGPSIKEST